MSRSISIVNVGTPAPKFQEWESAEVRFHGFAELDTRKNHNCDSSQFTCCGHRWHLRIYPGGTEASDEGMVGVFLCNMSKKSIKIDFGFSIKTSNASLQAQKSFAGENFARNGVCRHEAKFGDARGTSNYTRRATILDSLNEGAFVIVVKLKMAEPSRKPPRPFVPENPSACKIIQDMFMDEKSADVVFEVGSRKSKKRAKKKAKTSNILFHAHSFILQQCSTTLADLCESMGERSNSVTILDVPRDIFHHLLHYIYGGKVPDDELKKNAKQIIDAADKYGVPYLKLEAEASLVDSMTITTENVMDHLLYADAKNCALLKEHVMDYMVENKLEILEKISFDDVPGALIKDVFAAFARVDTKSESEKNNLCTMRISDLRRKVHEKGLDVDGSREALIAALKEHS